MTVVPGHGLKLGSLNRPYPTTAYAHMKAFPRTTLMSLIVHPPFLQLVVLQTGSVVLVI